MSSTLSREVLLRYHNKIFIETGSFCGEGIAIALSIVPVFHSIESDYTQHILCVNRFIHDKRVNLYFGSSPEILKGLLQNIHEPITFWLDAHSAISTVLLDELDVIAKHDIKNHTILIDDLRVFPVFGITVDQVKVKLKNINNNYIFKLEPNFTGPEDILVALCPEQSKNNTTCL